MSRASWIRPSRRLAIYFRDGFRCVYCRADAAEGVALTLDHLAPGCDHRSANLATACHACNSSRRHLSLAEWFAALRSRDVDTRSVRLRVHRARRGRVNLDLGRLAHRLGLPPVVLANLWQWRRR